jgi:site-specific DNA-methyltransferase (adenine-specific)
MDIRCGGFVSKGKAKVSVIGSSNSVNITDFLNFISRKAKSNNVDQFLRNGHLTAVLDLFECGKYFLTHAMGCGENDFIPNLKYKDFACYVPVSEHYYPWAFFAIPSSFEDIDLFFDMHGREYLLSADSGKKDFAIITNFRKICVYDFNHQQEKYECSFSGLYDALNGQSDEPFRTWQTFLHEFGPSKAEERKKSRRKEVVEFAKPKEASPELQYVKRFGHMPSFDVPVGYDRKNFRDTFKTKDLPFLTTESVDWDGKVKAALNVNKLVWGDNLSVMRALPDDSIDLVYIDPPFFSGRDYNCIFGDDDEVRSFKDIWDGGLPTYLAWLNARLWEIKRLLKPTGSVLVHLDWHASHYVKCELDKIFGYGGDKSEAGFRNEIIWSYNSGGRAKDFLPRKHDVILWYTKTKNWKFNGEAIGIPRNKCEDCGHELEKWNNMKKQVDSDGRTFRSIKSNGKIYKYYDDEPVVPNDVWLGFNHLQQKDPERIGYPTQKPERLLERIILAMTNPNDVVADFFSGGGTTISVAEKLGRKWIGCDISRIAVSVARDRILETYIKKAGITPLMKAPKYGFSIEYHGVYERDLVRELPEEDYIDFVLRCYQAVPQSKGEYIHGFRETRAVYVAPSKRNLRKDQIEEFHAELVEHKIQNGTMLTWNISKELEKYVDDLRQGTSGPDIQLVQVKLVDIDSNEFKGDNIRFINKPAAVIRKNHKSGLTWVFDATASHGTNGSDIHYYQWDFNHRSRFSPSTKPNFKDNDNDGNPLNDNRRIEYTFPAEGKYTVALRIFDKSGANEIEYVDLSVTEKAKKVS